MKHKRGLTSAVVVRLFGKALARHVNCDSPERALVVAVLKQALQDSLGNDPWEARRFFVDGRCDAFVRLLDGEPFYVRELAQRAQAAHQPRKTELLAA